MQLGTIAIITECAKSTVGWKGGSGQFCPGGKVAIRRGILVELTVDIYKISILSSKSLKRLNWRGMHTQ
jgi:hypothetical protein